MSRENDPHPVVEPGRVCRGCGIAICGRQQVISRILAGKKAVRCLRCLEASLGSAPEELCRLVGGYLVRRDCYRREWERADVCDRDGQSACCPSRLEGSAEPPSWCSAVRPETDDPELPAPDLEVDAEEAGCGDLMVLLLRSIRRIEPGDVLAITARDPGAAEDIPSWSRLTGHELLAGPIGPEVATYYLRRKPA